MRRTLSLLWLLFSCVVLPTSNADIYAWQTNTTSTVNRNDGCYYRNFTRIAPSTALKPGVTYYLYVYITGGFGGNNESDISMSADLGAGSQLWHGADGRTSGNSADMAGQWAYIARTYNNEGGYSLNGYVYFVTENCNAPSFYTSYAADAYGNIAYYLSDNPNFEFLTSSPKFVHFSPPPGDFYSQTIVNTTKNVDIGFYPVDMDNHRHEIDKIRIFASVPVGGNLVLRAFGGVYGGGGYFGMLIFPTSVTDSPTFYELNGIPTSNPDPVGDPYGFNHTFLSAPFCDANSLGVYGNQCIDYFQTSGGNYYGGLLVSSSFYPYLELADASHSLSTTACIPDQRLTMDISDSCGLASPWTSSSTWSRSFGDGSKLEATCAWAFNDGRFPWPAYIGWFTDPSGTRSRIAQCLFHDGYNDASYVVGHLSSNPSQSCLVSVDWQNVDGGSNDGSRHANDFLGNPIIFTTNIEPYIDELKYHLDASSKKLSWTDEKCPYPDSTHFADTLTVGNILTGRVNPISALTHSVDPVLGPGLDAAFDAAWTQLQADPGGAMMFIPGCDLNADGVCNVADQQLLAAANGKCVGQPGYIARLDFEGSGCITAQDVATVQSSFSGYSSGCTRSMGYWKNHITAWPVISLELGGIQYAQSELLAILKLPVRGNGIVSLAHQLIAAKLNILAGASPVAAPIGSSDAAVQASSGRLPPLGNAFLSPSVVSNGVNRLTQYNEGLLGPPACSE